MKPEDSRAVPAAFQSIDEAAHAYAGELLDADGFIAAAVTFPTVKQNPRPDREWWDDWVRIDGPVSEVRDAFRRRLIPADLYDATVGAMARAGHEA